MSDKNIKNALSILRTTLEDLEWELKHEGCDWLDENTMSKNLEYLESAIDNLEQIKLY